MFDSTFSGPRTELLKLRSSELPYPYVRTPATLTQDEDCDDNTDEPRKKGHRQRGERKRGRGGRRKQSQIHHEGVPTVPPSTAQNDMAPVEPSVDQILLKKEIMAERERMSEPEGNFMLLKGTTL